MNERIIFHVDVNNAFLSWTAVYLLSQGYEKDIRKIPSIIGGDENKRHGIVLAKSPIAKKYGIVTAETIYSAKKKCSKLEIYQPNHQLYYQKSKELMDYLHQYTPILEQFSIDECFMDMTGTTLLYSNYFELAYKIKNEIKKKFGYTVNVGIGNNKLCAKMASDFEKPDKVHTLLKNEIEKKLWPLPVNDLFMCGKKTAETLNKMNIYTIKDLSQANYKVLEKQFKSQAKYLKEASFGIDNSPVIAKKSQRQSISITETLEHDESNTEKLKEILFKQVENISRQLRDKKLYAQSLSIIYKDKNFKNYSAQVTLDNPTDNTKELLINIIKIFDSTYNNEPVRLIGVRLAKLTKMKNIQTTLFSNEDIVENDEDNIQKTIDNLNKRFGKSVISPASLRTVIKNKNE